MSVKSFVNGSTFVAASAGDVFGNSTSSTDHVRVLTAFDSDVFLDQGIDRVILDSDAARLGTEGNKIIATDNDGNVLFTWIAKDGQQLEFTGGRVATLDVVSLNTIQLQGSGGATHTLTAASAAVNVEGLFENGGGGEIEQPTHQPTADEQYMLELLNRARLDPLGEAARSGIDLNEGLSPGTLVPDARQPLAFNNELTAAARAHSQDMWDRRYLAHINPDGESPFDRIQDAGYTFVTAAENLAYNPSAIASHFGLFVDAGVTGRAHRVIMLDDNFKEVGIGISSPAWMYTQNFGTQPGAGAFLLGVVYDDADNNDFYTPGEGLGNVVINLVKQGSTTTQTLYSMDAGGYQVALEPGTYDITYTSGAETHAINNVVIGVDNVKLDWVL